MYFLFTRSVHFTAVPTELAANAVHKCRPEPRAFAGNGNIPYKAPPKKHMVSHNSQSSRLKIDSTSSNVSWQTTREVVKVFYIASNYLQYLAHDSLEKTCWLGARSSTRQGLEIDLYLRRRSPTAAVLDLTASS